MCKEKRCPARATEQGRNPTISGTLHQLQHKIDKLTGNNIHYHAHITTRTVNPDNASGYQVQFCTTPALAMDK